MVRNLVMLLGISFMLTIQVGCSTGAAAAKKAIAQNEQVEFVVASASVSATKQATGKLAGQYLPREFEGVAETAGDYFTRAFPSKNMTYRKSAFTIPAGTDIRTAFKSLPPSGGNAPSLKFVSFIDTFYSICGTNQIYTCLCMVPRVAFIEVDKISDPNHPMPVFTLGENRCWKPEESGSITYNTTTGGISMQQAGIPGGLLDAMKEAIKQHLPPVLVEINQSEVK